MLMSTQVFIYNPSDLYPQSTVKTLVSLCLYFPTLLYVIINLDCRIWKQFQRSLHVWSSLHDLVLKFMGLSDRLFQLTKLAKG